MRLMMELVILAMIVVVAALAARIALTNMEDDAFDAELTEISNQRARRTGMMAQEMN